MNERMLKLFIFPSISSAGIRTHVGRVVPLLEAMPRTLYRLSYSFLNSTFDIFEDVLQLLLTFEYIFSFLFWIIELN